MTTHTQTSGVRLVAGVPPRRVGYGGAVRLEPEDVVASAPVIAQMHRSTGRAHSLVDVQRQRRLEAINGAGRSVMLLALAIERTRLLQGTSV